MRRTDPKARSGISFGIPIAFQSKSNFFLGKTTKLVWRSLPSFRSVHRHEGFTLLQNFDFGAMENMERLPHPYPVAPSLKMTHWWKVTHIGREFRVLAAPEFLRQYLSVYRLSLPIQGEVAPKETTGRKTFNN